MAPRIPEERDLGRITPHRIYRRREAAALLGLSIATLERWARAGIGPKCIKIGPRACGYRGSDLLAIGEDHAA